MSQENSILGVPNLTIVHVKRSQTIEVWAKPEDRPDCIHCSHSPVRIKSRHSRTVKHTRPGNQLMLLPLTVPKYHCSRCNRYFRHRFKGLRPRLSATECFRLEVFEAHEGELPRASCPIHTILVMQRLNAGTSFTFDRESLNCQDVTAHKFWESTNTFLVDARGTPRLLWT